MTENQHLLILLSEECDETSQRAIKALRFGMDEIQEGQPLKNSDRLVYEFNDLMAVMELLHESGMIDKIIDREAINNKKLKIAKYTEYSKSLGTVG